MTLALRMNDDGEAGPCTLLCTLNRAVSERLRDDFSRLVLQKLERTFRHEIGCVGFGADGQFGVDEVVAESVDAVAACLRRMVIKLTHDGLPSEPVRITDVSVQTFTLSCEYDAEVRCVVGRALRQ